MSRLISTLALCAAYHTPTNAYLIFQRNKNKLHAHKTLRYPLKGVFYVSEEEEHPTGLVLSSHRKAEKRERKRVSRKKIKNKKNLFAGETEKEKQER